ncbi:MAG: YdiU family protein [Burkholderiaceae bacterium]|nr:YdiU family protein [Burkholderiaceae bacterium]
MTSTANPVADSFSALQTNNSFAALGLDFFTRLPTTPLKNPRLVHVNQDVAALLGFSPEAQKTPEFLSVVSGTAPMPGGDTLAAVYSGHQFGVWAGQLGDGRAHLLGEIVGPTGNWELQLKGAGMTPYSRMGDGRAVLRSSVREYLASQAMHGLGVATTRALSLVSADDPVMRETVETAAVVARVAPSFVRFGSFEHWASRNKPDLVRKLSDYVIERFYPECLQTAPGVPATAELRYVKLLEAVVKRTADLMASWQVVGFCHGVMNTDNMSILGLTLDYGPYGFMDGFDARHICNHTDSNGRYAWHAQPAVAHWNLYQLANSLHAIVPDAEALRSALNQFEPTFLQSMQTRMSQKLGLRTWQAGDETLIDDLWSVMQASHADFSMTFRQLAYAPGMTEALAGQVSHDLGGTVGDGSGALQPFVDLFVDREAAGAWLARYRDRVAQEAAPWQQRVSGMLAVNPLYVLRNYLAQQAIESTQRGDFTALDEMMTLLADPFTAQVGMERYASMPPHWASKIEVSCSS